MVQDQSLSYSEFMSIFSEPICTFIFPATTSRFSTGEKRANSILNVGFVRVVDFGAIWCQALCHIIDAFSITTNVTSVGVHARHLCLFKRTRSISLLLVARFHLQSQSSWLVRSRSLGIDLRSPVPSAVSGDVREDHLRCSCIVQWSRSFSIENRLLPVFKNFINDTNADIRALACQKLPILAQSLE